MTLAEISIRRPVFAWMLMAALILFGVLSFQRLGISQLPDVDFPVLSVNVTWEGAAPEVIESEIVDRLEQAIISVQGIRELSSSIRQGAANITVEFTLDQDIDVGLQAVQSAISRVRLPLDVDPPTIRKTNPEDQPILWLGLSSTTRSLAELSRYVDLSIRDQFQILPGVAEVVLGGFTERSLRVWADNSQLQKFELTILDLRDALLRGHRETAAGIIENEREELNLRVMGEGVSPEEIGDIRIMTRGGRPVYGTPLRVRDVARVEDGLADIRRISRVNGIPGVGLGIRKQRGANAVAVATAVRSRMAEVSETLPPDMTIGVNFDSTVFIKEAVDETEFTLLLSALVTALVCWLFLGSFRPTVNILLSLPTSIIGAFSVIYAMGFTLNLFTLLGLALAIGIVVDDAIMVLENIYRHGAMGKSRAQAALDGANEITFAAIASTFSVIAIFLPVAFMEGIIGEFFFQFGVTISAAVGLSLLEAVTLTPMRCSEIMEEAGRQGVLARTLNWIFVRIAGLYRTLLKVALRVSWLVVLASAAVFSASLQLLPGLRKEFIPPQDQSTFLIRVETPVGSSLEFTSESLREGERILRARNDVARVFTAVGGFGGGEVNTGILFVTLRPRTERSLSQAEIMREVREEFARLRNMKSFFQDLSTRGFTAQRGFPVEVNIRGGDWRVLERASEEIVSRLNGTGLVVDTNTDYRLGQPEVRVIPLRDAAARRGVSIESINDTVSAAIGGIRQGKFTKDGRRYDVRLQLLRESRARPEDVVKLQVRNIHGELIPLAEVVRIESAQTLQTITRRNRERSISIYANVAPGRSQVDALAAAERIAREVLPPGYRAFLGGGAQTFRESFESLLFVLWLGVAVAYMILASQFNSYLDPLTVLLSLPFSVTGAFLALWLGDQSINLYSLIGIILLMGIVKKNAILLVEFTNQKRFIEKLPVRQAILEAAPVRLRPILMTSFSTLAAALPPALAIGPGAESRIPMSITIIGGVFVSTLFTLFVVPCAYSLLTKVERRHKWERATSLPLTGVPLTSDPNGSPAPTEYPGPTQSSPRTLP